MCTPLAIATDSLILLVSLCPQDACASVDVLNLFDNLHCIALLYWLVCLHLPYCLQWVLVIAILSTSLSACVVIVSLNCIDLYWIVLLHCIVYLHIPLSLQWVPVSLFSSPTCLLVCLYFSCRTDDLFVLLLCIISCVIAYWHWHLLWYSVCFHNCWGQSPLPSPL